MWRQIQYRLCSCAEFSQAGGQVLCTLPKLHGCCLICHSRHRRLRWRNHLTSRLEKKHGIRHFSNQRALLKKSDVISERIDGYLKEVLTGNDEGKLGTTILWLTLTAPHSLHQLRNVVSYSLKHMNTENINTVINTTGWLSLLPLVWKFIYTNPAALNKLLVGSSVLVWGCCILGCRNGLSCSSSSLFSSILEKQSRHSV